MKKIFIVLVIAVALALLMINRVSAPESGDISDEADTMMEEGGMK